MGLAEVMSKKAVGWGPASEGAPPACVQGGVRAAGPSPGLLKGLEPPRELAGEWFFPQRDFYIFTA